MRAELLVEQSRHERRELVGRLGEAQADGVLAVAGLKQRVADHPPDRVGRARHALAEDAPDLQQLAPWQPGVDEALDHARGLDVLVGEDALAAPRVGPADGLHELAQEGRRQARLARDVGERVAARAAERELDGERRQAVLGRRALDLLVVGARLAQARQQPLAIAGRVRARCGHRSIQARIWSYTAGWLSRSKWVTPPTWWPSSTAKPICARRPAPEALGKRTSRSPRMAPSGCARAAG